MMNKTCKILPQGAGTPSERYICGYDGQVSDISVARAAWNNIAKRAQIRRRYCGSAPGALAMASRSFCIVSGEPLNSPSGYFLWRRISA